MTRTILFTLLAISGCAAVSPAPAADLTFPDRGRAAVVDAAHVLRPADAAALNAKVAAWDNATGHQLAIVTIPSLQGDDIADYGYRLGRAWGLGRKGINDGALLEIAPVEHRVRIDVGRGLEGDLTDAETSVILHETVVPKLKAGDIAGAANAGADAIMAAVPAGAGDMANAPQKSDWSWLIALVGLLFGSLAVWMIAAFRKRRRKVADQANLPRSSDAAMRAAGYDIGPPVEGDPDRLASKRIATGQAATPRDLFRADPYAASRRSTTIVAPVIINNSPSYDSSPSWGSSSGDSGSSSSSDSGSSSSGFDSGGGDFGGGGSDGSW